MVQGKANQWIHVLLPALLAALRALGDAPARSLTALAQRIGVSEADAATVVTPLEEHPGPLTEALATAPTSPPFAHDDTERRIVKDRSRLWKAGVRDLVMELCCALHNFRVRLTPWQPMVYSG